MAPFAPVVCALDLAPESEPALVAAAELAVRSGMPLHLVSVQAPGAPDGRRALQAAVDRALGLGACDGLAAHVDVARGDDAAAAILAYAARVEAGSLVLGTHGRRGLQRFRLGSVAEEVVRGSGVPVLVVPNASVRMPGPGRPVLVPIDLSETGALHLAGPFARLFGAEVHVLAVLDVVSEGIYARAGGPDRPDGHVSTAEMEAHLASLDLDADEIHVAIGAPADQIVRFAETMRAGTVVMETHGHRGLARALLGSVTEAALRRLACPVLTLHAPSEP